jgi:hypothetical protein
MKSRLIKEHTAYVMGKICVRRAWGIEAEVADHSIGHDLVFIYTVVIICLI